MYEGSSSVQVPVFVGFYPHIICEGGTLSCLNPTGWSDVMLISFPFLNGTGQLVQAVSLLSDNGHENTTVFRDEFDTSAYVINSTVDFYNTPVNECTDNSGVTSFTINGVVFNVHSDCAGSGEIQEVPPTNVPEFGGSLILASAVGLFLVILMRRGFSIPPRRT